MENILETKRLTFRKIKKEDCNELVAIFQDKEVMYAWEHTFSKEEINEWILKNIDRYERDGFSYFYVSEKNCGKFVGVIGPLIEEVEGKHLVGIAYILKKSEWGQGYAIEGARACLEYAFFQLNFEKVIAEIRPLNTASIRVAKGLGMKKQGQFIKYYQNKEMIHEIFCISKKEYDMQKEKR